MTNTEVKAGQFETDEIHRTITFSLIIIRMEQHWAEGIEMESTQHTAIVFKRPGNIPVDTVLDIRGEACSTIDNIESA